MTWQDNWWERSERYFVKFGREQHRYGVCKNTGLWWCKCCPGRTSKAAIKRRYHKHPSQHNEFNDNVGNRLTLSQPAMSTFHLYYYLLTTRKNHMMKDDVSKDNSQLSVHYTSVFFPRAIEKSKNYWSIMVYVILMENVEPRNGLNINDLLRNSLNKCHVLRSMWRVRQTKENSTDGTVNSLQQSRFESQCGSCMQVNFSLKHDWNLKWNFPFPSFSPNRQWFLKQVLEKSNSSSRKEKLKAYAKPGWLRDFLRTLRLRAYEYVCISIPYHTIPSLEAIVDHESHHRVYSSLSFAWDRETKIKAQSPLANLRTFRFIFTFLLTKK